jgi:hypothetical protein
MKRYTASSRRHVSQVISHAQKASWLLLNFSRVLRCSNSSFAASCVAESGVFRRDRRRFWNHVDLGQFQSCGKRLSPLHTPPFALLCRKNNLPATHKYFSPENRKTAVRRYRFPICFSVRRAFALLLHSVCQQLIQEVTVLLLQLLFPLLIFPGRLLIAWPVKVDHIACGLALEGRIIRA